MDRRRFLKAVAGGVGSAVSLAAFATQSAVRSRFKAVAFDAFPILDPRPVSDLAERIFPGRGAELSNVWRTRQFEYQWLRTIAGRYADFRQTTEDALVFATRMLALDLTPSRRTSLMGVYENLRAWPDVPQALHALRKGGIRLTFLSNMTESMLEAGIRNSGLQGAFEHVLSTDRMRTFKPDPRAYRLAMDALRLEREEILFAAFAGWDAAGAKWFGYPTFWVNRLGLSGEELGAAPDAIGRNLDDLARYVGGAG
jgi:2-haloacid dehalogenase